MVPDRQTKSRKIPTRKILPLLFVDQGWFGWWMWTKRVVASFYNGVIYVIVTTVTGVYTVLRWIVRSILHVLVGGMHVTRDGCLC